MEGLLSIQDLFASRAFRIPAYQRGYSWEERQWADLIEDLEVLPAGKEHFTGQIVLQPTDDHLVDKEGSRHRLHDVVDGQQRLTTLVLLLEAIRRRAGTSLAEGIEKRYIRLTDRADQPQPKLRFSDGSQPYYEQTVLNGAPALGGPRTKAQERLSSALTFFEEYLERESARRRDGFEAWLQDLHDRVAHHLKVNVFDVHDPSEVGLIFEVLNSRGRPLSQLDLVKNYVLYVGTKLDVEHALHDDVSEAWTRILTGLMNAGLGSAADENQLLRAHWLLAYDHQKKRWDGSRSVKARFRLRDYEGRHPEMLSDLRVYVRSLKDASVAYADIQRPTTTTAFAELSTAPQLRRAIIRGSERLHRTRAVAVFLPLLIATRLKCAGDGEEYRRLVDLCERYAFRVYRLLGRRADAGETVISRLAYSLYHGEMEFEAVVAEFKSTLVYYCSEQRFREAFELEDINDWYGWSGIKYFLYEYEQSLVGNDPVEVPWEVIERLDRDKTIEHVLPQTPTDPYWTERFDDAAREAYTHDLGNLALTADNSSYGNKPFPAKKGSPGSDSPCYANANLKNERELTGWYDWTVDSILERRQRLVDWAIMRWAVDDAPLVAVTSQPDYSDDDGTPDEEVAPRSGSDVESSVGVDDER